MSAVGEWSLVESLRGVEFPSAIIADSVPGKGCSRWPLAVNQTAHATVTEHFWRAL